MWAQVTIECATVGCQSPAVWRYAYSRKSASVQVCEEHTNVAEGMADVIAREVHRKKGSVWFVRVPVKENER